MGEPHENESHADSHDRDKLERWRAGLEQDALGAFPICAVFLVSESDQNAHDSFRRFRDSFESRNAGFHHLVIFGQHGVSSAVRALLAELSLSSDHLPCLVMVAGAEGKEALVFQLPSGNESNGLIETPAGNETPALETLLVQVESLIDGSEATFGLADLAGGVTHGLGGRTLAAMVSSLSAKS